MGVLAEQIAASALADWLRRQLPAKVTAVNALRAAVLKASTPGPYTIGASSCVLSLWKSRDQSVLVGLETTLTTGSRTTAQCVSEINTALGTSLASADSDDRLTLTSDDAPSGSTPSVMSVFPASENSANSVFGWDPGGEHVVNVALVSPGWRGVADGWPATADLGPGFWVIIGDRSSAPVKPDVRRDEYLVTLDVAILYAPRQQETHRNREPVHAALRCVREVLLTTAGRQLGRATTGDIMLVTERGAKVSGRPWQFIKKESVINPIYDVANLQLEVRVFERPASS